MAYGPPYSSVIPCFRPPSPISLFCLLHSSVYSCLDWVENVLNKIGTISAVSIQITSVVLGGVICNFSSVFVSWCHDFSHTKYCAQLVYCGYCPTLFSHGKCGLLFSHELITLLWYTLPLCCDIILTHTILMLSSSPTPPTEPLMLHSLHVKSRCASFCPASKNIPDRQCSGVIKIQTLEMRPFHRHFCTS